MTVWIAVTCPGCHSTDVSKNGKTSQGKQRYICRNKDCPRCTFIQDYTNNGYKPEVKQQIVDMSVNGSGVRDTARVLKVSTSTVIKEIKKNKNYSRMLTKKL